MENHTPKNPDFIPLMEQLAIPLRSPKNGDQVAGYAALRSKFLAYIYNICGTTKFSPRLAFGRTLNFLRLPNGTPHA